MASADRLYRRILAYTRFFSKGWGPVDTYEKLLDYRHVLFSREGCADILRQHPQKVKIQKVRKMKEGVIYDGVFFSPLAAFLPGLLPQISEMARFELILPHSWRTARRPVYIHLAGTGDHYFWRRRNMTALPTLRASGIGAVSLENPFYGTRKPPEQTRSQLHHVSDLFVLGMALILECMVIMHWLEEKGLDPVGLTGFSMGGHNCSLAGALWPKAVAVVPCLSWSTASSSFTEGLLSRTVCWDVLEEQLGHCRTGRDQRRQECFRRITDLETATLTNTPTTLTTHAGSVITEPGTSESDLLSNSIFHMSKNDGAVDRGRGGLEPASSVVTASISHLLRQAVVGVRSHVLKRVVSDGRGSRDGRWPRPHLIEAMRMVLDSSTHHQNFPVPLDPSLVHFVTAERDAYIPRSHITHVQSLWEGCEVEYITGGHISATILKQPAVHRALEHTIQRAYNSHL